MENRDDALRSMARKLRRHVVSMTSAAGSGHVTSSFSCAELVTVLFFHTMRWDPSDPSARNVDTFILSKGHAAPILWSALYEAGAIHEELNSLRRIDSTLEGHPTPRNPWVKVATGSLGQGLPAANGIALANRLDSIDATTYCLLGDGECSEGSVWEAAQFASLNRLANLVAIVDLNALAQSGFAPYRHDATVLARRFEAFGWHTAIIDGHDVHQIVEAFDRVSKEQPTAIIAKTVKGKGVSFLEGAEGWHGKALKPEDAARALTELGPADMHLEVPRRRVGEFDLPSPEEPPWLVLNYRQGELHSTRDAFGKALKSLGDFSSEIVVLDGDVKNSTMTEYFAEAFPQRFFQCYIAEQNMVGTALGLSVQGKIAVASTFAAFFTRAYDFVRMAGHSHPPRLIFCGSHAGISIGEDGPSQMGLEDLAMFRATHGSTVLYPADAVSAGRLLEQAVVSRGLVYLRTTRGKTPVIYGNDEEFPIGGSKTLRSSEGDRITLVAAGVTLHEALAACDTFREKGIAVRVVDGYSVKPLDRETLLKAAAETGLLLVIEDHWAEGGLGEAVATELSGVCQVHRLAIFDEPRSGKPEELLEAYGISRHAIVRKVEALLAGA